MNELNKERREVATRLRSEIKYMCYKAEWYEKDENPEKCGNKAYRNIAAHVIEGGNFIKGNYLEIVSNLADLIDRPTCKPKDRGRGYVDAVCDSFWCPNCSFEIDVHIGEDQHLTEAAKYCPNCGAEVVE